MIQNFRGKNTKDIETAIETLIVKSIIENNIGQISTPITKPNITSQLLSTDNFDNFIEKRK